MRSSCWARPRIPSGRRGCPGPGSPAPWKRARRRDVDAKAERIQAVLRAEQLTQPPQLVAGYVAGVRATVAVIAVFNAEIATLAGQVEAHFGRHPDAEISVQPARAR